MEVEGIFPTYSIRPVFPDTKNWQKQYKKRKRERESRLEKSFEDLFLLLPHIVMD